MIDAHMHFWRLDRGDYPWPTADLPVLFRDFLPQDAAAMVSGSGVTGVIAVQAAETEAETEFLCQLARQHSWVRGVVGWSDLAAPDAADRVAALARRCGNALLGLRPMLQDMADRDWIAGAAINAGIDAMIASDLALDALVRIDQFAPLARRAERSPDLRIVIDHAGKPDIANEGHAAWASAIAPLAAMPHVHCKLSGLLTEAGGRPADVLEPYIATLIDLFGPDRLIWGSDYPVLLLAGDYGSWLDQARRLAPYPQIFGANAARFYRLDLRERLLLLSADDNVAVALADLAAGEPVPGGAALIEAAPFGFKVAVRAIPAGAKVMKYGTPIGSATRDIAPGETVHLHNMQSDYTRSHTREMEQEA